MIVVVFVVVGVVLVLIVLIASQLCVFLQAALILTIMTVRWQTRRGWVRRIADRTGRFGGETRSDGSLGQRANVSLRIVRTELVGGR